ncbi:MAG TPA: hypothetical protein VGF99_14225, partial [Myxococcota bacterium]
APPQQPAYQSPQPNYPGTPAYGQPAAPPYQQGQGGNSGFGVQRPAMPQAAPMPAPPSTLPPGFPRPTTSSPGMPAQPMHQQPMQPRPVQPQQPQPAANPNDDFTIERF